jgi:ATP-dependent exoDNAse (exonuclease V) beta subunit
VAITFTNAAAAEMKERILDRLTGLVEGKENALADILLQEGLTKADLQNADRLLEKILYNYSFFNVSTIDSFFHKILRAFNKELELPMNFDIFLESDEALDYAVDNFIYRSHTYPDIHAILVSYIREKINNGNSWGIRSDLYRIAQELLKDNSLLQGNIDIPAIQDFIKALKQLATSFEDHMHKLGSETLQQLKEYGLEVESFKYGKSGPIGYFICIQKDKKEYAPKTRFLNALSDEGEWYTKKSPEARQIEETLHTFLLQKAQEAYQYYETNSKAYNTAKEILRSIYTFAVYEELNKMLTEYREKENVVLISDFTKILAQHILHEEISFIYSKIGSRYAHYLIDEFQDTSSLQWLSLKPLVENAVAQGSECLVVGDSKQAIYRWRGGEVELIETSISERDFPEHSSRLSLNRNFRSCCTVVDFNNSFFRKVAGMFAGTTDEYRLLESIFKDVSQEIVKDPFDEGFVQLSLFAKEGRRENFLQQARERMLEQVHKCLEDGYNLKDITVLVRDKKDSSEVARFLFEQKLDFITQDSLYLDHSPAVRLLLSLLGYLSNPADDLAKTQVMYLYLRYFRPLHVSDISFHELLNDFNKKEDGLYHKALPQEFVNNTAGLASLPVYELVEELVRIFGLNEAPDAYLQRLQDVVLEYSLKNNLGIQGFLNWWQDGKFTVILPEDQDAIQIMTIHKSKGLEFPIVIIPFADWDFQSGRPNILWVSPEEEPFNEFDRLPVLFNSNLKESYFEKDYQREEALTIIDNLNLLYVAFTRAKDRLYVATELDKGAASSIKSTGQLIKAILAPNQEGSTVITYGAEHLVSTKEKEASHANVEMKEYIVTDWRDRIHFVTENPTGKNERVKTILLSGDSWETILEKTKGLFATEADIAPRLQKLFSLSEMKLFYSRPQKQALAVASVILSGKGAYRPDKYMEHDGHIYLLAIGTEQSEALKAYSVYTEKKTGKKTKAFLLDICSDQLQEII